MSDIELTWAQSLGDIQVVANDVSIDEGLQTAIVVSLFSDRRADDVDALPFGHTDRRGWWGDVYPTIPEDRIGSRLWLLSREKELPVVLVRAKEYAVEALQWLLTDRVASRVDVVTEFTRAGMLGIGVTVYRPVVDPVTYHFNVLWTAQEARQ